MQIYRIKSKWHIIIIVACLFIYSFFCWINFGECLSVIVQSKYQTIENVDSIEKEVLTEPTGKVVINKDTGVENKNNILNSYFQKVDGYIDSFNTLWSGTMVNKSKLSEIDSLCTFYITKEIMSSQVIYGKNNWLFYKSTTDGDSIADYEGSNRYTSAEMNYILGESLLAQRELEQRGIECAILVAPNKENVYSKYMPETYIHESISSTDILIKYLDKNDVSIISPKAELLDNSTKYQLYYSYDTHWNQLGAYIGVKSVFEAWDISEPDLSKRNILTKNLSKNYHYCGDDDLARMVGLRDIVFNDELEYEIDGTIPMDWQRFADEQNNNQISYFSNPNAQKHATLLLVGDSFRSSMIPALREKFTDVYVAHRLFFTADMLDEIRPNYFIAEYVERNSDEIGAISSLVLD